MTSESYKVLQFVYLFVSDAGLFDKFPTNGNNGTTTPSSSTGQDIFKAAGVASDPWATPPNNSQKFEGGNVFTPSMVPAANPNNPFL